MQDMQTIGLNRVAVHGSWAPAGAGAITSVKGKGFTAARTGVGEVTVTFDDEYPDLVAEFACGRFASASGVGAQTGTYNASNKTLIVRTVTMSTGAAVDVAADANNRVSFQAIFRNTSVDY
jgi:hypothetical protein